MLLKKGDEMPDPKSLLEATVIWQKKQAKQVIDSSFWHFLTFPVNTSINWQVAFLSNVNGIDNQYNSNSIIIFMHMNIYFSSV